MDENVKAQSQELTDVINKSVTQSNKISLELENTKEVPEISLEDAPIPELTAVLETEQKTTTVKVESKEYQLSDEEMKTVKEFSKKIDITNSNQIIQYGANAQSKLTAFSNSALEKVKTKDMGEVGGLLSDLVVELKGFSTDAEDGGFFGLFKKIGAKIEKLKAKYAKVEINVDKIAEILEGHQITLLKDIALLQKMYEMNVEYAKELAMYIAAGEEKLNDVNTNVLPSLKSEAEKSGALEDAQKVNDLINMISQFEKRIYDLKLTRNIAIQMGPQIRLIQNNDSLMVQKIQSSIVNTIPLWKNQMVLALSLAESQQAMESQKAVTDVTNEMLIKNAEKLKTGSIETAKESERGIVEVDTLVKTNKALIDTIDEVIRIQEDGKVKRQQAEVELVKIEDELKTKLKDWK